MKPYIDEYQTRINFICGPVVIYKNGTKVWKKSDCYNRYIFFKRLKNGIKAC
jgi:hypothetical protein